MPSSTRWRIVGLGLIRGSVVEGSKETTGQQNEPAALIHDLGQNVNLRRAVMAARVVFFSRRRLLTRKAQTFGLRATRVLSFCC